MDSFPAPGFPRPQALRPAEIRDAGVGGDPRPGQHRDRRAPRAHGGAPAAPSACSARPTLRSWASWRRSGKPACSSRKLVCYANLSTYQTSCAVAGRAPAAAPRRRLRRGRSSGLAGIAARAPGRDGRGREGPAAGRCGGGRARARPGTARGWPGPAGGAGPAGGPGRLLGDLARLRRQTRAARHAYWFPLVLFGLLTCGAAPLYVAAAAPRDTSGALATGRGPLLLNGFLPGGGGFYIGWYWAAALAGGYLLTVVWYRWHARRAGVVTPARGYLITGVVLTGAGPGHPAAHRDGARPVAGMAAVRGRVDQGHARVPDHRDRPVGAGPGRAQPRPGGHRPRLHRRRPAVEPVQRGEHRVQAGLEPAGAPSPGS